MIEKAIEIVKQYIDEHIEDNPDASPSIFVVWQSVILDNFKCGIATTLPHGMHFELTYDGERKCWYMDAYRKIENREIACD